MNRFLLLILVIGIILSVAACGAPESSTPGAQEEMIVALSTGDHRVFDALNPSQGAINDLRGQRSDGPYVLGRALERRGRDAAAQLVYQAELNAGGSRWAGLSAVRLAVLNERRDDSLSAQGYAQSAVDLLPEFRDGWMALGTSLYRREDYAALIETANRIPPPEELTAGERVSVADLHAEAALWRAVSAWELGEQSENVFRDAFVGEPVGAIHERLFLYLFYRNNGASSFSPHMQLLMEAVYRQERGESREALRLIRMIEPEILIGEILATDHEGSAPGIWESLIAMVRDHSDSATASWLERLRGAVTERAEEETFRDVLSMVDLIRAEAAVRRRARTGDVTELLTEAAANADTEEMRRRIAGSLVTFSVDRERALEPVVDDLQRLSHASGGESFSEAYATAADRLLPRMVQNRMWREIALLLERIPGDARVARNRMLVILVHAADAGLVPADDTERKAWDEELAEAVADLSAVGYTGMLGRERAGLSLVDSDSSAAEEPAPEEPPAASNAAVRELNVAHAEALVLAGDSRSALFVAMAAARSAHRAPQMIEIATRMAELGHTSDALDVARRAVSRAELPLTPEIIELIYPLPFRAELRDAADRYRVPVYLLTALVREESHFRPIALSPVGAQGLGQIMPDTAGDIRRRMDWPQADVSRPADNLLMSAYYLDYLAEQIESPVLRLAAYNAGLGRGRRWQRTFGDLPPILQIEALPFVETRWYLRRIAVSQVMYRERMLGTDLESGITEFVKGAIW